jgi:carboxyl-terminal processing protease
MQQPRDIPLKCSALLVLGALLTTLGACSGTGTSKVSESSRKDSPGSPPPTAYQTFDVVWTTVKDRHFDPEHNGVDWERVRWLYRPMIEGTRNEAEVRAVLQRMLGELGQSHFVIIPAQTSGAEEDVVVEEEEISIEEVSSKTTTTNAENSEEENNSETTTPSGPGTNGMRLGWVEGQATVLAVKPGSPAAAHGIEPGWTVTTIRGKDPRKRFAGILEVAEESNSNMAIAQAEMALDGWDHGTAGEIQTYEFLDVNGDHQEIDITYEEAPGVPVKFGNLPEMTTEIESYWLEPEQLKQLGVNFDAENPPHIGYIRFNLWMFPIMTPVANAVDTFRDAEGIVIDLRGNTGGLGGLAMGVAGHFINEDVSLGTMKMRDSELTFTVNPQRATMDGRLVEPYAGHLALLIDPGTASTSEVFGAGIQQLGRARVFGRNSMGAALPSHTAQLPNGDVFMYAVANFIGPAGTSIEGTGVVPDEHVILTQERLASEWDPDLKAATTWILEHQTHEH